MYCILHCFCKSSVIPRVNCKDREWSKKSSYSVLRVILIIHVKEVPLWNGLCMNKATYGIVTRMESWSQGLQDGDKILDGIMLGLSVYLESFCLHFRFFSFCGWHVVTCVSIFLCVVGLIYLDSFCLCIPEYACSLFVTFSALDSVSRPVQKIIRPDHHTVDLGRILVFFELLILQADVFFFRSVKSCFL